MKRLFLLLFTLTTFSSLAQTAKRNEIFQMLIKPAKGPLKMDGKLDEAAWFEAAKVSDFVMCNPTDTLCSNVRTDVRMTYDDKYLYISAECFLKDQSRYVVESLKRDFSFGINDNFLVFIDTFDDKTTGFSFGANAAGAQWDGQMSEGAKVNLNWDNKWESSTFYNKESWIWEAAIPFKSIRYKNNSTRWGINFSRLDLQAKEKSAWAPVPRQFPTASLAYSGVLLWETPPPAPKQNISVIPYVLSGVTSNYETKDPTSFRKQIGGDIKVALSSSMNMDLTINPDFSQVDVDRQQTNLDRFELFYPEKRQFFIENSDLFDGFGTETIRPFFSRRIGLALNTRTGIYEQTPITYGARVSGKLTNDWRIGLLNVQSQRIDDKGVPTQNYSMVALQRKLFARSNVGIFMINKQSFIDTDLQRQNGFAEFNRNIGVEYNLASSNNFWTGKVFYYQSISPDAKANNFAHAASLAYKDNHWIVSWKHQWVGESYNPEVGYVPRVNYTNINPEVGKIFYPKSKTSQLFYAQVRLNSLSFWNNSGGLTDNTTYVALEGKMKDQSSFSAFHGYDYVRLLYDFDPTRMGNIPVRKGSEHTWRSVGFGYISSPIKLFTYSVTSRVGGYYGNGNRTGITGELGYRFQPHVGISVALDYNDIWGVEVPVIQADGTTKKIISASEFWIVRPKVDITFTNKLFFTTFFQLNQQTKNMNLNARLQWRYKPASDLFLVYTDNYLPENFHIRNRSIVLKLNYWLNL
ncbi:DUF5916 domain-containing protein [Aquirufa aurantiipilula]|uniref:DUF5916 domain-containing protein n=1 Tax=Aquirufa aurantiipilula TaxID=2696561 RepID=A0ABT6BJV4_9BACT|nr:DUF5916 domain-containing protein [Aquirufa aurantiipilula]MDF5690446.1 DUF5916 domain-containing protein [Aquirufa aurantiipilula]